MRIQSLTISNFRVIKSASIDFPDKVIAIIGKNGVGKSSIIEAISWALYGNQAARSGKDEIKSTFAKESENCEVKVTFFLNEEQFTVIRRLVGRTNRAEVELFRGDKSESVGVNETKVHVGNLLGLDWRGYLSSFLARQSELNALSDLVPSKRKDHIAGMLGIERLDKAIQTLKQDTKLYKEKSLFLERSLSGKETIERFIDELQAKLNIIEAQLAPLNQLFEATLKEFEKSKQQFEIYSEKKNKFVQSESKIKAQQSTLEYLKIQKDKLRDDKTKLDEQQYLLQELLKLQEKDKEIPLKFEQLKKQQSNKKYAEDIKKQQQALLQKIEINSQKSANLKTSLENLEAQFSSFPENLEKSLREQKLMRDDKRSQYSSLQTEIKRLKLDIEKLANQLSNIANLKSESICERCLRPLGDDFESIKKHIENEIKQFEKNLILKSTTQNEVLKQGEELKISIETLEKQHKSQIVLQPEIESVRKEIAQSQQFAKEYQQQKIEISKKLKEIGDVDFDEKEFENIRSQFVRFEENRNKINRYQGQLERYSKLLNEIDKTNLKISSTQKIIDDEVKNLDLIGYSELEFGKVTEKFNQSQSKHEESKNKLFEIKKEKELTALSLQEKQQQQEMFKKSEKEFEETKTAHYYSEKLGSLFTLYRHDLIASIRPTLADLSSRLFNEMSGNKYNLVELDEKYELRVMDDGQFYGVERFSGGEKDLANLCLRLAISLSLTETAGLNGSFIILDEVFGSQDNERKDLILSALANLKNRFPQIILITHIEDIKDGVEQIIEVKQNEFGYSEVAVHGS